MRTRWTVSSIWSGLPAKPGAMSMVSGRANRTASTVTTLRISNSQTRAERVMVKAASSPSSPRSLENTGTKAMVMEPSAKSLRRVLGSR